MKLLVLENAPAFASTEEWTKDNISRKREDFTGVSSVTAERNTHEVLVKQQS